MDSTYHTLVDRLFRQNEFAIKLGTDRIRAALDAESSPDRQFTTILVAGTNGKGSVSSFIHAGLLGAGYRVGLYTSPHLVEARERIRVDGSPISRDSFVELAQSVLTRWGEDDVPVEQRLTFFELLTAMACLHFAGSGVQIAVFEVGMGGRLDATNALEPALSVVTPVAYDHERHLGSDLPAILGEKLGILRAGRPAVVCRPEGWSVDETRRHVQVAPEPLWIEGDAFFSEGAIRVGEHELGTEWLPLPGVHQVRNAACALAALELGRRALGWAVGEPSQNVAWLSRARWPGRWSRVEWRGRELLVDGAHNPHGARSAAQFLGERFAGRVTIVSGMLADKDALEMWRALAPHAKRLIAVPLEQPKSRSPAELAESARAAGVREIFGADSIAAGLDQALTHDEPIVVLGSLYLAGTVFRLTGQTAESLQVWS